jgi:DNA-3-methyladenine glycosylase
MNRIPLSRSFYERETVTVAKELLGKILVKGTATVRIVETEAYVGPDDKASHAFTKRKETAFPMWGPAGYSYVYLTYGLHYMFNISTENEGFPGAVLIRGVEPIEGLPHIKTNGPGKLTKALGINNSHNNLDLTKSGEIFITKGVTLTNIVQTARIGIDYAQEFKDKPWRFYIKDNPYVSRY